MEGNEGSKDHNQSGTQPAYRSRGTRGTFKRPLRSSTAHTTRNNYNNPLSSRTVLLIATIADNPTPTHKSKHLSRFHRSIISDAPSPIFPTHPEKRPSAQMRNNYRNPPLPIPAIAVTADNPLSLPQLCCQPSIPSKGGVALTLAARSPRRSAQKTHFPSPIHSIASIADNPAHSHKPNHPSHFHRSIIGDAPSPIFPTHPEKRRNAQMRNNRRTPSTLLIASIADNRIRSQRGPKSLCHSIYASSFAVSPLASWSIGDSNRSKPDTPSAPRPKFPSDLRFSLDVGRSALGVGRFAAPIACPKPFLLHSPASLK